MPCCRLCFEFPLVNRLLPRRQFKILRAHRRIRIFPSANRNRIHLTTFDFAPRDSAKGMKLMIRKLKSGEYRLYSRKKSAKTGKRRNLGTFRTRKAAQDHER